MFGLFGKKKVTGTIASVEFKGAGPNSGQLEIVLEPAHQGFYVGMDTPRQRYFEIFEIASAAMWDSKRVEIAYQKKAAGNALVDLREI